MRLLTLLACVDAAFLSASLFSHTVALRLLLLLLGAGLAAAAVSRNRADIHRLPPIWLAFLLWSAWAALSVAWSIEPGRTLKELQNEVGYTALALWICFVGAQAPNAARIFLPVVAAAAVAAMAIGLRDFSISWERYLVGLHGGPGDHSSALLTLMPCAAMAGWYGWRARWPLLIQLPTWIFVLAVPISAYFTLNRTVWLGLGAQALLVGAILGWRQRASTGTQWSLRARMMGAVVAIAVVAGTAFALSEIQAKRESSGGTSLAGDHRLVLWPEIFELIGERPLTGYGFGRGLLRDPLRAEFRTLDPQLWHAHNIFLEALVQMGVPGLILLPVLLGALLRRAWRLAHDAGEIRAACGIALMGVVTGMLVRNMTDTLFVRQNSLLFWGVTGALLGLASLRRADTTAA